MPLGKTVTFCIVLTLCAFFLIEADSRPRRNLFKGVTDQTLKWKKPPTKRVIYTAGGTAILTCAVKRTRPKATIKWLKNGKDLGKRNIGEYDISSKYELLIDRLVDSDAGNYTCLVRNEYSQLNRSYVIMVMTRPNDLAPFITNPFVNKTAVVGTNVSLRCDVMSDPIASIFWLLVYENSTIYTKENGRELFTDYKELKKSNRHDPAIFLNLTNVQFNDSGHYACLALNQHGITRKELWINVVEEEPVFYPTHTKNHTNVILFGCLGFGMILLIFFTTILAVCYKKRKGRSDGAVHMQPNSLYTIATENVSITFDPNYEISRSNIQIGCDLGHGEFGCVKKAIATNIAGKSGPTIVAVKMLKENARPSDLANLVTEMNILKYTGEIKHRNVISMLGCCTREQPFWLIVEYAMHGNLQDFLRERRPPPPNTSVSGYEEPIDDMDTEDMRRLTYHNLISFAFQVSRGMQYLSAKGIVHRDLAARNVLVSQDFEMKIADFGLTRYVSENEEYRSVTAKPMPIKWLAPEALEGKTYTSKSDVWSFGILCWEIHTLGGTPYATMTVSAPDTLRRLLKAGTRMEQPHYASTEIYELMLECWQLHPKKRPTFKEIVEYLDKILTDNNESEYTKVLPCNNMDTSFFTSDFPIPMHYNENRRRPRTSDSQYSSYSSNSIGSDTDQVFLEMPPNWQNNNHHIHPHRSMRLNSMNDLPYHGNRLLSDESSGSDGLYSRTLPRRGNGLACRHSLNQPQSPERLSQTLTWQNDHSNLTVNMPPENRHLVRYENKDVLPHREHETEMLRIDEEEPA